MSLALATSENVEVVQLMHDAIARCRLDLTGAVVLTEAASGPYRVTPVLAALAGAKTVLAVTRSSRYGTAADIAAATHVLARLAGVGRQIEIVADKRRQLFAQADIVTNSGHVRPLNAQVIDWLKPSAVISLMYEAWEYRPADVDLAACRRREIAIAGTNERHPAIAVFSFLGALAAKLLHDAGIALPGAHIVLLCDNPFLPRLRDGLTTRGASVECCRTLSDVPPDSSCDALLVALRPQARPCIGAGEARAIARRGWSAKVVQFWGDLDRASLAAAEIPYWPLETPQPGHMGILPSAIGPEPVVRLQCGGLKVAQVLRQPANQRTAEDLDYLDPLEI